MSATVSATAARPASTSAAASRLTGPCTKRDAVLAAAGALFMAQGYGAVSMDGVAKAAGDSKATLYAHFASKDALFAEIVGATCARLQAEAEDASHHHGLPLREALVALGARWLGLMLSPETVALRRVVVAEGARFPNLAHAVHAAGPERLKAWLTDWVAEEQRRGRLQADVDAGLAAAQFLALLSGDLYFRVTLGLAPAPPPDAAVGQAAAEAAETFLRAFGA